MFDFTDYFCHLKLTCSFINLIPYTLDSSALTNFVEHSRGVLDLEYLQRLFRFQSFYSHLLKLFSSRSICKITIMLILN